VVLLSVGDTARISVDAIPDRKVNGVVYEIANTAKSKGLGTQEEVTNFEVKIRILAKDIVLRPGMSMTADIETETRKNVLAVPVQSVTTRGPKMGPQGEGGEQQGGGEVVVENTQAAKPKAEVKPKEVVFVVENGVVKAMPVKRGIANATHVEILDGVGEGAEVVSGSYKAINRELEDGTKVRVEDQKKRPSRAQGANA
jgi:HlyD family secretion protein